MIGNGTVITMSDSYRTYREGSDSYRSQAPTGSRKRYRKQKHSRWPLIFCVAVLVASIIIIICLSTRPGNSGASSASSSESEVSSAQVSSKPVSSEPTSNPVSSEKSSAPVSSEEVSSVPSVPELKDDPSIDGYMDDSVFVYGNSGFEGFYGTDSVAQNYAQAVSSFANALGNGVTVYNLVAPTHPEFGLPERFSNYAGNQRHNLDTIFSSYTADNVVPVDIYDNLLYNRDQYIYFNTDHHWTALGAYYGYCKFAEVAGFAPLDINKLEKRTKEEFRGTLYAMCGNQGLYNNPDHVDYYIIPGNYTVDICHMNSSAVLQPATLLAEFAEGGNAYSVFIWGDNPLTVVKNPLGTGRKIAVIKDSFGNAFSPFLVGNYDEVHIIDMRYFPQYQQSAVQYIKDNGITEVLFLNNIMAANTGMRIQNIQNLI